MSQELVQILYQPGQKKGYQIEQNEKDYWDCSEICTNTEAKDIKLLEKVNIEIIKMLQQQEFIEELRII